MEVSTEIDMRETLLTALLDGDLDVRDARSFDDAGLMTRNEGVVVELEDGSEFQITIVQSR